MKSLDEIYAGIRDQGAPLNEGMQKFNGVLEFSKTDGLVFSAPAAGFILMMNKDDILKVLDGKKFRDIDAKIFVNQ